MGTIATGLQTRQKDCYAPSDRVKLTLRTNGEERTSIITPQGTIVLAGIDEPETQPTTALSAGGSLTDGYYVYCYVYASSKYPFVENAVTVAGGELWPRSNPSPMSAVRQTSGGNNTVTITVTKSTQPGVDKILIYRTERSATSAGAQALADAGTLYYIATAANNGVAGTTQVLDGGLTDTGEELELDNYTGPTAEFCVFDGNYWWASGNPEYSAEVTLDGTSTVTVSDGDTLFDGRNAQFVTFDGISTGGFDGAGTWYGEITATDTVVLYEDSDLTTPLAVYYTGTTTMRIRGYSNILYRSKVRNPFSWGEIEETVANGQTVTETPQLFVRNLGGGSVSAIAVSPNGRQLVVHFESPQRTISLDLGLAESDQFTVQQQIIDNTGSVTAHFTLFNGYVGETPMMLGLDTYNGNILASDGYQQQIVSDALGDFLLELERTDRAPKFFHGSYDAGTELNCWWLRRYDTTERNNVMVWMHAPTGQWGWMPDFDVLCSGTVLDAETNERLTIGGTELGFMGQLLDPDTMNNWLYVDESMTLMSNTSITLPVDAPSVTQTSPSTGVFRTPEIRWSVGQEILLYYPNEAGTFSVTGVAILNGQTGYLVGDVITWATTIPDSTPAEFTVASVGATGNILTVTFTAGSYSADPTGTAFTWTATGATGSGSDLRVGTVGGLGEITSINIDSAGTGYRYGAALTSNSLTGGGFSGSVSSVSAGGAILSVQIDSPGGGYLVNDQIQAAEDGPQEDINGTFDVTGASNTVLEELTVESIEQISATVWETTTTEAYTASGETLMATWHPRYIGGLVNAVYVPHERDANCDAYYINTTFVEFDEYASFTITLDNYMRVGDELFITTTPYPWGSDDIALFVGGIPCAWRSYFDLQTPTISKVKSEAWLTSGPTSSANGPAVRFYIELADDSETGDCIPTIRDTLPSGDYAMSSFNRTEVPSGMLKQFGTELLELSFDELKLYNFIIKVSPTG